MFGSTTYSFLVSGLFILPISPNVFLVVVIINPGMFYSVIHDFVKDQQIYNLVCHVFSGLGYDE